MLDFWTSLEYERGYPSYYIRWMVFKDGTAIELIRWSVK